MEVGRRHEAVTARDRLLAEMVASTDIETRTMLWRAASKYNRRDREMAGARPEDAGLTCAAQESGSRW